MNTYTYTEVRQNLAYILDKAKKEGTVLIRRKDGSMFELKPVNENRSPLDVKGVDIEIDRDEILDILRETRSGGLSIQH